MECATVKEEEEEKESCYHRSLMERKTQQPSFIKKNVIARGNTEDTVIIRQGNTIVVGRKRACFVTAAFTARTHGGVGGWLGLWG